MKRLVKESLNEVISFERRKDPLSSLDIGYKKKIEDWLEEMNIEVYKINDDLTISSQNINLIGKNLIKFPEFIQFNIIKGNFDCGDNQLISLKGCPKIVTGSFRCSFNKLESLEYSPEKVGEVFYCTDNKIKFTKEDILKYCITKDIYVSL